MNIAGSSFVFHIIKSIPRLSFFELRCQVLFLLWLQYFAVIVCAVLYYSQYFNHKLIYLPSVLYQILIPTIKPLQRSLSILSYPHTLLSHSPVHTTLLQLYQIITVLVGAVCEYSSVCLNFSSCN